jgi:hypothetical protein
MKANPLRALIGLFLGLKSAILRLPSVLIAAVGRVLRQLRSQVEGVAAVKERGKEGVDARGESRILPRAERFAIETTIRYRNVGQNAWYQGKTENISGSGVLFRVKDLVAPKTRVEMIFPLLIKGSGACGANVRCIGRIVRKVPPVGPKGETGLAATIEEYLLLHAEEESRAA